MSKFQERRKLDFENIAWTEFASLTSSFTSTNVQPKPRGIIREPYSIAGAEMYEEKEEIRALLKNASKPRQIS